MNGGGGGSTDGGGDGGTMPPPPPPAVAPGITSGGAYTSVTVTMTSMPGATIYYRAASDTTTDLSVAIDPTVPSTYTGTGTSVTPAIFSSPGDVYRIKAMAVLADGKRTSETAIQRFDYDIDSDNDRLIEIRNLDMFNNIRNNLAGTTYDDEAADIGTGDAGVDAGCPAAGCNGYELMADLDFAESLKLCLRDVVNTTWCPVTLTCIGSTTEAGFPGIGPGGFTGIFEGNGNSISNFYSRNTADTANANIGLFANNGGTIRNIAVVDANVFGGIRADRIGGLVGLNSGSIIAGSVLSTGTGTSSADGGDGSDFVGGLVGNAAAAGSIITASYATSDADGGVGAADRVGGLVGNAAAGSTIIASYATGSANGGDGGADRVGSLAGNNAGSITASYAIGDADGGGGDNDRVGGLVGEDTTALSPQAMLLATLMGEPGPPTVSAAWWD